jgi:amino acid adenylation domain-containing protein
LPIQYADFALWQRDWLQGEVLESQLRYWKRQLDGSPLVLDLPADRPRPAVQTFRGARESRMLPPSLGQALNTLSRQQGVTLFMTLLAAFQTLLYRYTGQEDIVVGSPIANRNRSEIEGLIGFFVNTLLLRTDLSGEPTFRQFLGRVREVALGAYAHQDLPFEKLVEELRPERSLSHTPLFQVLFVLQNAPRTTLELAGLRLSPLEVDNATAKFDMSVSMTETEEGLRASLEYNTDLYGVATIQRMLGHYQTLLEGIVANPEERISQLPLLTPAERQQLLVEWNDTGREYPQVCVHELFEAQVERSPEAVAVVDEDRQLSYRELNRRANQLAHHLRGLGVGPEVLVGVCVERSAEMVVGLLGILKAGGAYVPLDAAYPNERLAFMLEDAGIRVLLTQTQLMERLPAHKAQVACLDELSGSHSSEGRVNLTSEVTLDNLAYVIYTSGSTGKPKGVAVGHRSLTNYLDSAHRETCLSDQDVLMAVSTLSFDIAGFDIYLPLLVGARMVIVSSEVSADGERLLETLKGSGASVLFATPTTWQLVLEAGWQGSDRLKILCGGEAMTRSLADWLLERGACVWNVYGPTETTIWSTTFRVEAGDGVVPIGRPISNTQIYLLDRRLQPVPIGVPGELHIGGDCLARGYLSRPEFTAEKFVPNPCSDDPTARLFKTGDLARYRPDGNIEFLGRLDHQVPPGQDPRIPN